MKPEQSPNSPEERVEGKTGLRRLEDALKLVLRAPKRPAKSKRGSRSKKRKT